MKEVTDSNFGIVIAFWIPGFVLLWGLSLSIDSVQAWLVSGEAIKDVSIGAFLYISMASLGLGLMLSAVRWRILDFVLIHTFVERKEFDFTKLGDKQSAFEAVVQNHYRYYQYYANTLVAVIGAFAVFCIEKKHLPPWSIVIGLFILVVCLFSASADTLSKYYKRGSEVLS